jgi:hypothetical protein
MYEIPDHSNNGTGVVREARVVAAALATPRSALAA